LLKFRPESEVETAVIKVWRRLWRRLGGMGKFVAVVVVGAGLSYAVASAAQVSRHDGTFWGRLGTQDKTTYVTGYSDAMHTSFGKLDSLKVAAGVFHWKGANGILSQIARELDMSGVPADRVVTYLDNVYWNPRYVDFDVANAIELAAMRGTDLKSSWSEIPPIPSVNSHVKR
jgi:hypothetical protein